MLVLAALACAQPAYPQDAAPRWRVVVVDTFNTRLSTPDEVGTAISRAAAMHANTLFVQVRRRGDAFYTDASEPAPEDVALAGGFDPLAELIAQGRAAGLDVHALLTLGPVWHQASVPVDPRHVYARHGLGGTRVADGSGNWLTRTRVADGSGTSHDGYRFGRDFWLDFGHPAAVDYVVDVVTRLVERYPVDGIHLDALYYPAAPLDNASIGYNDVAVARFQRRTGRAGIPDADDRRWSDWRREQVTAVTRRIAVAAQAVRPSLVVTAAAVGDGHAPGDPAGTRAQAQRFQNWFAWMTDGSVDAVVPQIYRQEHESPSAAEFAGWAAWMRDSPRDRPLIAGLGAYLNSAEGLVRQARAIVDATGERGGMALFSLAAINAPVIDNPLSVPTGRDTPQRPVEDMASILRTGRTTGGQLVDPESPPLFAVQVPRPALPWKETVGHLLGVVQDDTGAPYDGVGVRLESGTRPAGPDDVVSDGSGVFAVPSVPPGAYRLRMLTPDGTGYTSECTIDVAARVVTRVTVQLDGARQPIALCR